MRLSFVFEQTHNHTNAVGETNTPEIKSEKLTQNESYFASRTMSKECKLHLY